MKTVFIIIADNQRCYENYDEWIESVHHNYPIKYTAKLQLLMQYIKQGYKANGFGDLNIETLSKETQKYLNAYNNKEDNILRFRIIEKELKP